MDIEEVAAEQDTSRLWRALLEAKSENDFSLVRAIEQRMRELSTDRRFAHLSDDELRRVAGSTPITTTFNEAHRRDQHANIEATRSALLDEWERRQARR